MISILHAPLFRVVWLSGGSDRIGMLELLCRAGEIEDIATRTPTGKCGLQRLLIALLLDAYAPEEIDDRIDLLAEGAFSREKLEAYVAACEREGPRFLIDDEAHPFMQSAYDPALDARAEKPIAALMADLPSGNAHVHLDHRRQDVHVADVATAFEALVETYQFCPAGLSGPSSINNAPPVYALLHGSNLFETLALNMVSATEMGEIPLGVGDAPWRREERVTPKKTEMDMTLIKALTWRPRRAKLIVDDDGMVRRVYLQPGLDFKGDALWRDPHVPYYEAEKGDRTSWKPRLGRQMWRDAGMLVPCSGKIAKPPIPLKNIATVWPERPALLDVELFGLVTRQASLLGWAHERLRLPETLFWAKDDPSKGEAETPEEADRQRVASRQALEFRDVLRLTEDMYRVLTRETGLQFKEQTAQDAGQVFLQAMHSHLFGEYMEALTRPQSFQEEEARRRAALMDSMRDALAEAHRTVIAQCGTSVESLRAHNKIRGKVLAYYYKRRENW